MAKEVNIHIKATETEETKRKLQEVGQSAEAAGRQVGKGGQDAATGLDKMNSSASGITSKIGQAYQNLLSWARGLGSFVAGIAIATRIINENKRAIEEHGETTARQQNKLLRLQYLGDLFREKPQLREEVGKYAEFGRRPFEEVADAWYNLRSKSGDLSPARQKDIMIQALEFGRTDPGASLDMLVDMFTLYAKKTGETDANRIQNVINQTNTVQGGSLSDMAKYLPQFLPIGITAGLTGAQSAGLWAGATAGASEVSTVTNNLRNIVLALQGKGTPEGRKVLQSFGITEQMNFFHKMALLSTAQQQGKLGLAEAEQIVGKENTATLIDLTQRFPAIMEAVGQVTSVDTGDMDITADKIRDLIGTDEYAKLEEDSRKLDIQIENIKGGHYGALKFRRDTKLLENVLRKQGRSEAYIQYHLWKAKSDRALGYDSLTGMLHDLGLTEKDSTNFGLSLLGVGEDEYELPTPPPSTPVPAPAAEPADQSSSPIRAPWDITYWIDSIAEDAQDFSRSKQTKTQPSSQPVSYNFINNNNIYYSRAEMDPTTRAGPTSFA